MSPEELRGLLAEASAGRWVAGGEGRTSWVACRPTNGPTLTLADVDSSADAALIVAAVNSLPGLLASVDRVQELTRVLRDVRSQLNVMAKDHTDGSTCGPTCASVLRTGAETAVAKIDAVLNPAGSDA